MSENNNTADREIKITKLYDAPVNHIWNAWSNLEHISKWWGPDGFTTSISKMDLKPGGEWILILHGTDGTDYPNRSIFTEIVYLKKIAFDHVSGPKFTASIEFIEQGEKTLLTWHMLFETKEQFEQVVKTFKAEEGLKQNIEKLASYLKNNF